VISVDTPVTVRYFGVCDYADIFQRMQSFNQSRNAETADEIWLLQHWPVFTLGLNGKAEHVLDAGDIPVIKTDRGGQVTYHGPGQLIIYTLFDVRRNQLGIRDMVTRLEQSVIDFLASQNIEAIARKDAPGVYVQDKKIAALGLRIKSGGSYHGLSLNVDMDLSPFSRINPCGYAGLEVTSLQQLGLSYSVDDVAMELLKNLQQRFGIERVSIHDRQ
jgi:lipoyl(octanoyl) transferase